MSSSVSPRQRDIGEVASLRAEGVDPQPRSGFSAKIGKTATLILAEPLRLRHLPYPRYRAAEEDITRLPTSQFSQLSTLNSQPFSTSKKISPAHAQSESTEENVSKPTILQLIKA
ncbi:MAG TPA: hypothetical protein IAD18_08070 [Candidatus Limisoma intestinavium]|uniref:Uncharacterized protein n=1 Tax=Candidatus Limisoma intestinavium TaxID=2840856 RepID=A0A9D1IP62_9BACT|nr:hypothetical protein [Candidatus Limisoma intestinavium]